MKRATMIWIITMAITGQLLLSGCGGGGGGSEQPAASPQTQQPASTTANIAGKVIITGVEDYTGVVVVAEKTTSGVTARVQSQLDTAETDPDARISARQALDTPGVYTTETDSAGNYAFASIPPGKYSISAYKESTLAAQPRIVEATAGQAVTVDFELVATGSITGTVTLSGAASGNSGTLVFIPGTSYSAYANDAGTFTMSNVPVGTYTLTFARDGYTWSSTTGVTVSAGASAAVAAVSLSPTVGGLPGTIVCNSNNDCDDSNNYTDDICNDRGLASSSCANLAILCIYSADCSDGNGLTTDICNNPGTSASSCTNAVIACLDNSMCNDSDNYTYDTCVNPYTSSAYCSNTAIACLSDADCNDSNALTTDTCSNPGTTSSACSNVNTPPIAVNINPAANVTDTSLDLSWSMSPDSDFASYKVYNSSTLVTTITTKATTNAAISGLAQNTAYTFTVQVCDTTGACTTSNPLNVTTAAISGSYVSGILWNNTTWTLANSPYIVSGLVQVPTGVTLTIEPGVNVVYLNSSANIEIHGALIANGTSGNEIVFRSVADGTNSGANMITFHGTADTSLSQIDYITVKWGAKGIYNSSTTGTLTVSNSTFTNNSSNNGGGIYSYVTTNLSYSTITSISGIGQGLWSTGDLSVTYTEITGYAVGVYNTGSVTAFHHNNVYGNSLYQFTNEQPVANGGVIAENNWWGTTDLSAAPFLPFIYDYYDSLNFSAVDVDPILPSPELTAGDPD